MSSLALPAARPRSWVILGVAALLLAALGLSVLIPQRVFEAAQATGGVEVPPPVIRFGGPGAYKQNQKMWGLLEVARTKGFLDKAFAGTGTRLQFIGFTTVPMVGEALASGEIDFAGQGELIALLSRSAGTRTRVIMPVSRGENAYLVVPVGSPIHRVEDIRGKRIAFMRGAYIHIQTLRILADHGLSEKDIVPVNLDPASAATVMASGGIDGTFVGGQLALPMRDRGVGRIAYSTRNEPRETAQTGLIVSDAFARRYPGTTQKVVDAMVQAARCAADPRHREELISLWVYGTDRSLANVKEDLGPGPLTARTSPLIDPFVLSQYRNTQAFAQQAKLQRNPVDLGGWIDTTFLDRALRRQGLENFWPRFDPQGRPHGGAAQFQSQDNDR
ncbi:ABC transporter substrate-binding protein [Sphingomonas abietis]|uniref:ABC transporter substrate-binding protein n=1 Tax=Sphingomonas abietis TaxID=3012344 RepID=A0ABY7NN69_9SPHN|nr:ABC transporter substrate-binding protein [Sphingomonas abietis]WBO21359.1 ABC transporter substrate-binding protein [Sphingomonas abietis]